VHANGTRHLIRHLFTFARLRHKRPERCDGAEPSAAAVAAGLIALGFLHLAPLSIFPASLAASRSTDVQELMWRLLWGVHALVTGPALLMDANTFFPDEGTYATMDYLVGVSVLALPFRALTRNPLAVYNLTAMASLALSAWGAYLLCRELTGSRAAASVGAAVFALNPVHVARLGQLNVFAVHALPFVLLALHRLFGRASLRGALPLAAALVVALTSSGYQAVFASGAVAWAALVLGSGALRTRWRALVMTAGAVALAGVLFTPLARPYVEGAVHNHRERTLREVRKSSPSPAALVIQQSVVHDWIRARWDPEGRWIEDAGATLFPGVVVVMLGMIGFASWMQRREYRLQVLYGGLAVAGFALSLGTTLPGYATLYDWLPPLHFIRAPSRFSLPGLLGLAVLAAAGVAWLREMPRVQRGAVIGAIAPLVCVLHLAETWRPIGHPTLSYSPPPAVYEWLAAQPGQFGIVELPTDPEQNTTSLVYSTFHWKPLVNGYHGSFISRFHHKLLFEELPRFPAGESVESLGAIEGLRYVVLHTNPTPEHFPTKGRFQRRRRLSEALEQLPPTLRLVWRSDEDAVLEIVQPQDGWKGLDVQRIASASALRGRTLSFEARTIESALGPLDGAELTVMLDAQEVGRGAIGPGFSAFSFALPPDIEPGMHRLRFYVRGAVPTVRLARVSNLAIGRTGVFSAAWVHAISHDPHGTAPARIEVNGASEAAGAPGYVLVVVNPVSATVERRAHFDVGRSREDADRMAAFLEGLAPGVLVAGASTGPLGRHCTSRMALALASIGLALDPCSGGYRTHAFVGVKGAAPGTAEEAHGGDARAAVEVGSETAPPRVAVRGIRLTSAKLDR
jgi:hypothetical protein